MKNIFKYLPVVAVLAFASCSKDAPSKSEVEAGFDSFDGVLPTVTIAASATEVNPVAGYASVELTFSGLTAEALDSLSVGLLADTDSTFANATFTATEPVDGSVVLKGKVTPNSTCYLRGVVASLQGTVFSDVVKVEVPDIPFYQKIVGQWGATVVSGHDDTEYENIIHIVADETSPEGLCLIYGIDPFLFSQGIGVNTQSPVNVVKAMIDNDKCTLTIANYSLLFATANASYYFVGFDAPSAEEAEDFANLVISLTEDGKGLYIENGFGLLSVAGDEAGLYDYYAGGVTYVKK